MNYPGIDLYTDIIPEMKRITKLTLDSVYESINPLKRDNTFEVFGLDFMIDDNYKTYLIEFNTNPCLELSANLLQRLIP